MKKIPEIINYMLQDANITQSELSKKSGVCNSSISEYLKGTSMPSLKSFFKIAKTCGYKIVLKKEVDKNDSK